MFYVRKNICSHRKKNLLFLPCNVAAVQNLYSSLTLFLPSTATKDGEDERGLKPKRNRNFFQLWILSFPKNHEKINLNSPCY